MPKYTLNWAKLFHYSGSVEADDTQHAQELWEEGEIHDDGGSVCEEYGRVVIKEEKPVEVGCTCGEAYGKRRQDAPKCEYCAPKEEKPDA